VTRVNVTSLRPSTRAGDSARTKLPKERSPWAAVLVPTEHGGWGLTLEPVLLGLLVAPGWPGLGLGLAAFATFLARTPSKIVLVDAHRHRSLDRTRLARRAVVGYAVVLAGCLAVPFLRSPGRTWLPLAVAAPMVAVELWFDMRSRGRRLVPELAGAIGIAGIAAMIALADGRSVDVAVACWLLLAARAVTSIITVRDQVGGLHGRPRRPRLVAGGDVAALGLCCVAIGVTTAAIVGALAVAVLIVVQRLLSPRPTPRAVVLGLTQTALGLIVVGAAALGVSLS
jgi:hypothetical protein